ncbi:hypothetical protein ASU80_20200 [Enterobacter hormaechei subsp. xiangfangensis]|uniref:hypothetical protein n=1 Tax=Enterobacter hormaechei TaxID=158836 RepID=UPI0007356DAD|nr:hypothetical protein [Enterobacter hormaechei]KTI13261.1 hypothetical protein ASV11_20965 [Enterobacter hormaechei subsp. xiangfangensis]KTJ63431.1 hypothetical protein ASU80_20200 [Enterobacter hormaechei subsp. xiangfangensis]MDR9967971.1 hypothetical protein [Enterobacter hormaechei subsp. xiangfangensis]
MFWRKRNLVTKWFTVFNDKKTPDQISFSRESMRDADMYAVYIRKDGNDNGYLFVEKDGDKLKVKEWSEKRESFYTPTTLNISDITAEQVYGTHYFQGYRIDFTDLNHLERVASRKFLNGIRKDRKKEEKQQEKYNEQERRVNDRMDVLNAIIELYMKDGRGCGLPQIATRIHSFRWEKHSKKDVMKRELELVIESFVLGGELVKGETGGYKPTGKALTTLGEHATHARRHIELSKLQAGTVWATFLAALAAVATATPVVKPYIISAIKAIHTLFFK